MRIAITHAISCHNTCAHACVRQGELYGIVKALLGKSTREAMIQWLAAVIEVGHIEEAGIGLGGCYAVIGLQPAS